jgi:hypothetical protein
MAKLVQKSRKPDTGNRFGIIAAAGRRSHKDDAFALSAVAHHGRMTGDVYAYGLRAMFIDNAIACRRIGIEVDGAYSVEHDDLKLPKTEMAQAFICFEAVEDIISAIEYIDKRIVSPFRPVANAAIFFHERAEEFILHQTLIPLLLGTQPCPQLLLP